MTTTPDAATAAAGMPAAATAAASAATTVTAVTAVNYTSPKTVYFLHSTSDTKVRNLPHYRAAATTRNITTQHSVSVAMLKMAAPTIAAVQNGAKYRVLARCFSSRLTAMKVLMIVQSSHRGYRGPARRKTGRAAQQNHDGDHTLLADDIRTTAGMHNLVDPQRQEAVSEPTARIIHTKL